MYENYLQGKNHHLNKIWIHRQIKNLIYFLLLAHSIKSSHKILKVQKGLVWGKKLTHLPRDIMTAVRVN